MKYEDITTWSVSKGVATPKNPYKHQIGKSRDFTVKISEQELYSEFKIFAQQHTYATNAPDGSYSADRFGEIFWQYFNASFDGVWIDLSYEPLQKEDGTTYRAFLPFIDQVKEPLHSHTDCRDEDGITVGLIDALISIARILKDRDLKPDSVRQALMDLASDSDISQLFNNHWIVSFFQCKNGDFDYCHGYTRVLADNKEDALAQAQRRWDIDHPHRMPVISKMAIKF